MFSPGVVQFLFFALIALLLFGNRLPQTMRSLGKSVNEFKKGIREGEANADEADENQNRDRT